MTKVLLNTDIPRECMLGWYPLIDETLVKIQAVMDRDNLDIYICQIKEKFGELQIYLSSYTDEIESLLDTAMDTSVKTCEICGKPGSLYNDNNWFLTRCDEHNTEID